MSDTLRVRALQLLARREHARAELARKLAPHAESEEALASLLDSLESERLLSNTRYAEARVHTRGARYGNARLAQELRTQGVGEADVDAALDGLGDELSRARQVWERKFGNAGLPNDATERARQTRFLLGRGFSGTIIQRILRGNFEDE